jgi:hypothetical protein
MMKTMLGFFCAVAGAEVRASRTAQLMDQVTRTQSLMSLSLSAGNDGVTRPMSVFSDEKLQRLSGAGVIF